MAEIATAFVSLLPTTSGFGRKLDSQLQPPVSKSAKSLGTGFGKAFGVAAGAIAAAGVGKFLTGAIADAEEARRLNAITANAIKATGGSAKVTAKQVSALASAIAAKTGIDDAQIQAGQNLILTFKNIANAGDGASAIFDRTTRAAVDLSAAGFGSIEGASLQLGKALNDPLKGISALSRSGVTFTQQQKDQIKALVESGRTLKAQKIILGEVESQVGGAAKAGATASGKFKFAFGEFKESIGTLLLPAVDRAAKFLLKTVLPAMERVRNFIVERVVPAIGDFASVVAEKLGPVLDGLRPVFDKVTGFLRSNPDFVKAFAIALGVLVGAIGAVTVATTLFSIALNSTGIPLVIIAIAALVAGLVVAYKRSERFRSIVDSVAASAKDFGVFLKNDVLPVIVDLARTIAEKAKPVLEKLGETFRQDILPLIEAAIVKFREAQPTIQKVAKVILQLVAGYIKFGAAVLGKVLPPLIDFIGFVIRKVVPGVADFIGTIRDAAVKVIAFGTTVFNQVKQFAKFLTGLKEKFGLAKTYVEGIPEKIKQALGQLGEVLFEKGKDFISGLLRGIKSGVTDAITYIKDVPSRLAAAFNGGGGLSQIYHGAGPNVSPSDPVLPQGHELDRFATISPRLSGNVGGGSRYAITITNWQEGTGYISDVADSRVLSAADLNGERRRAQWMPA